MLLSAVEVNDSAICLLEENLFRSVHFGLSASNAKLSVAIAPPNEKLASFIQCHRVLRTALDFHDIRHALNLCWNHLIVIVAMAQGTYFAVSPGIDFSLISQSCSMLKSARNLNHILFLKFTMDKTNFSV